MLRELYHDDKYAVYQQGSFVTETGHRGPIVKVFTRQQGGEKFVYEIAFMTMEWNPDWGTYSALKKLQYLPIKNRIVSKKLVEKIAEILNKERNFWREREDGK